MSLFLRKITLRAYVVILSLTSFIITVLYIIFKSDIKIEITGSIDINALITAFVALISVIMGWLFGRSR